MAAEEWDATGWDLQKAYLGGLAAEGFIVLEPTEEQQLERLAEEVPGGGPQVRKAAGGADVIDLRAMADELKQAN